MTPETLPPRKKSKRGIIVTISLLVVLSVLGYLAWTSPFFGKHLPSFTGEPFSTFTPLPVLTTPDDSTLPGQTPTPRDKHAFTDISSNSSTSVCGQTEPMFILALAIDDNEQADMIRLIRVDFNERRAVVLSIPRDFWVPIPGLEEHSITQFKINGSYGFGEYFNGPGQGVVKFSETIFYNYGIKFDRYLVGHFDNFERLIDAMGGVDIYLEEPIGVYATAGHHHFNGEEAVLFARLRRADLDRYRIIRQSAIIKGVYQKLTQPANLIKLPGLGLRFLQDKSVITDVTVQDVATFTCFIKDIELSSVAFVDIPSDLYTPNITNFGRNIMIPKPEVTTFIQDRILNGDY